MEFDKLFSILQAEPTLEVLISPFIKAYEGDAGKQLIGQISGAAISLGTLSTENLYYVLSCDDFSMSLNDPEHPKVVCIANNPQVSNIYSAVISLYLNNLQKLLKEQGRTALQHFTGRIREHFLGRGRQVPFGLPKLHGECYPGHPGH